MWFGSEPTSIGTTSQTFTIFEIELHKRLFIIVLNITKLQKYPKHMYRTTRVRPYTSNPIISSPPPPPPPPTKENIHKRQILTSQTFTIFEIELHKRLFIIVLDMTKLQKYPKHNVLYHKGSSLHLQPIISSPPTKENIHKRQIPTSQTFTIFEIELHKRLFIIVLDMTKLQKYPKHNVLYHKGSSLHLQPIISSPPPNKREYT